jgi:hypothetical protein
MLSAIIQQMSVTTIITYGKLGPLSCLANRLFRKVAWEPVLLPSNRLDGDIFFAREPSLPSGIVLFVPF